MMGSTNKNRRSNLLFYWVWQWICDLMSAFLVEIVITCSNSTLDHWWNQIVHTKLSHFLTLHTLVNSCDTVLTSYAFFTIFWINILSFIIILFVTFMSEFNSHLFHTFLMKVLSTLTYAFHCSLRLIAPSADFCIWSWRLNNLHLIHYLLRLLNLICGKWLRVIYWVFHFITIGFIILFLAMFFACHWCWHSSFKVLILGSIIHWIIWIGWDLKWITRRRDSWITWWCLLTRYIESLRLRIEIW